ncbi:19791_t:CDS:2 [Entrophospora sp. SA101]|nr:19791_t:CDS:2 [Entrophospora sp. SA101]
MVKIRLEKTNKNISKRIKVIEAFAKTSSIDSLNQNITASKGTI